MLIFLNLGKCLLRRVFVQDSKMLEDLNLPLCGQVLVPEEDNASFID